MSSIYNLEPHPTGSVILHTTLGDISVELFVKQTPLTCRNFLQLALDGYYDNTIFHRLIPGFIIQGGDPTGTGNGGESIYDGGAFSGDLDPWPMDQRRGKNAGAMGVNFKDEFHSRLKFNRRGLLAMANEGSPDSNGTQFFFTLGKAEELDGKNTIFGRVAGDTIYNLAKMGEADVEEDGERPLYPVKITSVEILLNPFEDIKKRERVTHHAEKSQIPQKRKKPKGEKKLLSFGDDEGEPDDLPIIKKPKFDTRIVMEVEGESSVGKKASKAKAKKGDKRIRDSVQEKEPGFKEQDAPLPSEVRLPDTPKKEPAGHLDDKDSTPELDAQKKKSLLERTNEEIAALKASMRRTIHSEPVREKEKSALDQMIPETSIRGRKRRPGGNNTTAQDDKSSLDLLRAFKARLEQAPREKEVAPPTISDNREASKDQDKEEEVCDLHFIANCQSCQSWDKIEAKDESDDEGWMSHSLSFAADKLGKDLSFRKKAEEELIVIDPREKAKAILGEKRAEKEARAGGSGRAWDQARNSQMARASALAGRGAK